MSSPSFADLAAWFAEHRRDLPWRRPHVGAWGTLLSEVMSQQTPVTRVAGPWTQWLERWPSPADLAAAPPAEVLRAWGSLGYPRRAMRLQDCARAILERHDGVVPHRVEDLRALPGIGEYTASAVASFAYRQRVLVLDTNVRRVLGRAFFGEHHQRPAPSRAEKERSAALLPADAEQSVIWNEGVMELGALVCKARTPLCDQCPWQRECAWVAGGSIVPAERLTPVQPFEGTDRQVRGRIMKLLRADDAASRTALAAASQVPPERFERVLNGLIADQLVHPGPADQVLLGPPR